MRRFTYKSQYGEYEECYFIASEYCSNSNPSLEIWDNEGAVATVSVNLNTHVPANMLAIKNYSENEGMVDFLIELGVIEPNPVDIIKSGFVEIPIHKLTDHGIDMIYN